MSGTHFFTISDADFVELHFCNSLHLMNRRVHSWSYRRYSKYYGSAEQSVLSLHSNIILELTAGLFYAESSEKAYKSNEMLRRYL